MQLEYPLIQAPMAGGPNTPEMVAAVMQRGAVGSFGLAYSNTGAIAESIDAARQLAGVRLRKAGCDGALNVNFFIFGELAEPAAESVDAASGALQSIADELETTVSTLHDSHHPDLRDQMEVVWDKRPDILTFHLGIAPADIIDKAHSLDIAVGMSATCLAEAQAVEAAGADFIVLQGHAAGGHRGLFSLDNDDEQLSTMDLLACVSAELSVPLVSAGGIMTREHAKNALAAGATAVQLGTAFLTTDECKISPAHKAALLQQRLPEAGTTLTNRISGRPARGISNAFTRQLSGMPGLGFPFQYELTGSLRAASVAQDNADYQTMWAGANYQHCRSESVDQLITRVFG